MGVQKTD